MKPPGIPTCACVTEALPASISSGVRMGVGVELAGRVATAIPTTEPAPFSALSCTWTGCDRDAEKPTHTRTFCCGMANVADTGVVQNSAPTHCSTATVPECAKPGIANVPFE